jgi:hypothetical protein
VLSEEKNYQKVPEMKVYSEYTAEELAMENLFIRWVRFPEDPSIKVFWENWVLKYPEMSGTVEEARMLVINATETQVEPMNPVEVNSLWGRIRNSLDIMGDNDAQADRLGVVEKKISKEMLVILSIAVMIVLGMVYLLI